MAQVDVDRALRCLNRVGLGQKALVRADQLSGGERQHVGIARALCQEPVVLLAMNRLPASTPVTAEQVLSLLCGICRENNLTAIVSLHQLELAQKYADRIIGLAGGEIVFDGQPAALTKENLQAIYPRDAQAADSPAVADLEERESIHAASQISFEAMVVCGLVLSAAGCGQPGQGVNPANAPRDPPTLHVALLPDEAAAKIIQDNQGLKTYLEGQLGKPIELHVLTNYAAMIEAVRAKNIDLAYFGPLSYCLAKAEVRHRLFRRQGQGRHDNLPLHPHRQPDAGIKEFAGIKGKKMGFGDVASTSSHLMPKYTLFNKAGLRGNATTRRASSASTTWWPSTSRPATLTPAVSTSSSTRACSRRGKIDPGRSWCSATPIRGPNTRGRIRTTWCRRCGRRFVGPFWN